MNDLIVLYTSNLATIESWTLISMDLKKMEIKTSK